jgi:hypothetical protein
MTAYIQDLSNMPTTWYNHDGTPLLIGLALPTLDEP